MALNINLDSIKKGVGGAAAVGSLFKQDATLSGVAGQHGGFLQTLRTYGISRPNKFEVIMTFPPYTVNSQLTTLQLYAIDVELPTREVYTEKSRIYGTSVEMPVDYQYGLTFQMVFYVDVAYRNVAIINDWMDRVVDTTSNDINYLNDYAGTINVKVLDFKNAAEGTGLKKPSMADGLKNAFMKSFAPNDDKYADPVATFITDEMVDYKFIKAYPKSMQLKRLSNNSKEFQEVTVTFAYSRLESTFKYSTGERGVASVNAGKLSFKDKIIGNVSSKVNGVASTAGGIAGSIANIARIGG